MTDPNTIAVYDARAQDYADFTSNQATDPRLTDFISRLPKGARVLDLGCGPGEAARIMAENGCQVTAWDASGEMVRQAGAQEGVTAEQKTFEALNDLEHGEMDGIWANFSLLHAPREDVPSHLFAISKALKPGGTFVMAVKTGYGEKRDDIGRLYTYFSEPELHCSLTAARMMPERVDHGKDLGLDGKEAEWISLTCRRFNPKDL